MPWHQRHRTNVNFQQQTRCRSGRRKALMRCLQSDPQLGKTRESQPSAHVITRHYDYINQTIYRVLQCYR